MTARDLELAAYAAAHKIVGLSSAPGRTAKDQDEYDLAFASARRSRFVDAVADVIKSTMSAHVSTVEETTPNEAEHPVEANA